MLSLCLLLVVTACGCSASRPVILVHGLALGYSSGMNTLFDTIRKENPDTEVYSVKAHANDTSLTTPMWTQVDDTLKEIKEKLQSAHEGVTIICYSQGKKYGSEVYVHSFCRWTDLSRNHTNLSSS